MSLRAHVADLNHHLRANLLLDVQVVIFHVRCLDVAVEGKGVAFEGGAAWGPVSRNSRRDRSGGNRGDDLILRWTNRVVSRTGIEVGRIRQMAHDHVLREGVEEDAVAGTNDSPAFAGHIPCDADARSEIGAVRVVQLAEPRLAHLSKGERAGARSGRLAGDVAQQIVLLAHYSGIVPTQAVIQGQVGSEAEIILKI